MALPIYSPLPSARSTRILTVKPSDSSDAPIECELKTIDLDDEQNSTSYEALSYVWGESDETNPSKILLHGQEHTVTPNLKAALRHLRGNDRPLLLWVDAICINQSDLSERTSQVEMMADIFKRAVTTVSWLGEGDADSDEAVELVREVGSWVMDHQNEFDDHKRTGPVKVIEGLGFSLEDRNWPSLAARGDFLNANGVFHCGSKSLWRFQFDALCALVFMCIEAGLSGNTHEPVASLQKRLHPPGLHMAQVLTACRGTRDSPDPHIDWLLRVTRRFQATDPRDKLFAVRGVVIDGQLVTPNYSKSFEEVVKDLAINHIRAYSSLQILLGNRFREHSPSWTPDILADDLQRATEMHYSLGHDKFWTVVSDSYLRLEDDQSREIFWRTLCLDTDSSTRISDKPAPAPTDYGTQFCVLFGLQEVPEEFMPAEDPLWRCSSYTAPFCNAFGSALPNRTFITTRNEQVHRMGVGPYLAKEGDIVVVLFGAKLCVVLRRVQGEDQYKIVGDAYIHGIMNGELVKDVPEDGGQVFDIV
ncbi:heterokaryon incompatibility protein [Rhypophila sp. PSN 637]